MICWDNRPLNEPNTTTVNVAVNSGGARRASSMLGRFYQIHFASDKIRNGLKFQNTLATVATHATKASILSPTSNSTAYSNQLHLIFVI